MINLLPPDEKRQLRAARVNTLLLRYNIFLMGAVVFLGLMVGITYVYLSSTKASAEAVIKENNSRVAEFTQVQSQADLFKANLATAKQILDNEVVYTKVMLATAALLPSGTILEKLSLDSQTFGTPTALVARATDYDKALKIKEAFQSSPLFSDVNFQSIAANGQAPYVLTVNLNVTIKKDAAK